jgi:hypothetical protein
MRSGNRRTATKVRDGRVQKKNNWASDHGDYHAVSQAEIRIDRRDPGHGSRHLITVAQLRAFLDLLPDWEDLTVGLEAIVLDTAWGSTMGWCSPGVVAVCAWEADLWWRDGDPGWIVDHREVLDILGVAYDTGRSSAIRWTEAQARAFQLLHILPHELGHHRDRITSRGQRDADRGEPYAETYALQVMGTVWPDYARHFEV